MVAFETRKTKYGYFCNSIGARIKPGDPIVAATWCNDGTRDMILTCPVRYVGPDGTLYEVPAGYRINGLSAPRISWVICSPFEPRSREASVVHDWLCSEGYDWGEAANLFFYAMVSNDFSTVKAYNRWAAVNYVGGMFQWRHRG